MARGRIIDTSTGQRIAVADVATAFLDHVRRVAASETCFLVVSPATAPEYRAALEELGVPLVDDEAADEPGVFVVAGDPSQWPRLKPEIVAEYRAAKAAGAL
jgi:hypothetical protein